MRFYFDSKTLYSLFSVGLYYSTVSATNHCKVPNVKTTSGVLKGWSPHPDVHAYVGIRFAEPPIGENRWQLPLPYKPSCKDAIVDATQPFASCYQVLYNTILTGKSPTYRESEDCLFVNVWKPAKQKRGKKLPVFIWIYGGGFGQGGTSQYEGVDFVAEQKDIIFVNFNYRINIFGFPFSSATTKNLGLLDQRLAIEWIRDNIEAFGGDPARMTLVGESAGSQSISFYSYAYAKDPVVSGLVELSGKAQSTLIDSGESWALITNKTGCAKSTSPDTELACLKALPPRTLRYALDPNYIIEYGSPPGGVPSVDNVTVFTPNEYYRRSAIGEVAQIPLLTSNTVDEGNNLVLFDPKSENPVNTTESLFVTLFAFQCPTSIVAADRARSGIPVWRAVYNGSFPQLSPYPSWTKAFHAADAYLLFGSEKTIGYEDPDENVLKAGVYYRSAIAAFVRDPVNGLTKFGWPRYNPEAPTLINLFSYNKPNVTFQNPSEYDAPCKELFGI